MTITYYVGGGVESDRLPAWAATIDVNGTFPDMSTGWTFQVLESKAGQATTTKTTGFTGAANGLVTVEWADDELADLAELSLGTWNLALVATRTSDGAPFTATERLFLRSRVR